MSNIDEVTMALQGTSCVVSALQGLHEVIVGAQANLLAAAIKANVPRFIPSDYCVDLRSLAHGGNRNFDLRREFHTLLDKSDIRRTSIFNGAFTDVLMYGVPLYDVKKQSIGYWGAVALPQVPVEGSTSELKGLAIPILWQVHLEADPICGRIDGSDLSYTRQ